MFIDYKALIKQSELDSLSREACQLTVSNERFFELISREELKPSIEKWYNSVWREMKVLRRLEDFVLFLREKLENEGLPVSEVPDSWVLKFFNFNLDLSTRYMVVDEEWHNV